VSQPRRRFLYKIWSGYDGFSPSEIPRRMDDHDRLRLGWSRYIDVLELGSEVWIYFHGPGVKVSGVYAKGFVSAIDDKKLRVHVRVREHSKADPLDDNGTRDQIVDAVAQRGRQVFFLPDAVLPPVPDCTLDACHRRHCDGCTRWQSIPRIGADALADPSRLPSSLADFVPAYWVVPRRCFLWYDRLPLAPTKQAGSDMFLRFKAGEGRLAYPLALGLYEALVARGEVEFDRIVPIPLSPDKIAAKELNRTMALARELARLLGTRVGDFLSLKTAMSKRLLRNSGMSIGWFEHYYENALEVDERITQCKRVLLIDDVCDHGSTIRCAVRRIRVVHPEIEIVAATAGQMIIKEAVRDPAELAAGEL